MKREIHDCIITDFNEKVGNLDKLLTERIEELHKVNGMQQCRHAYMFYRSLLWEINDVISDNLIEPKKEKL